MKSKMTFVLALFTALAFASVAENPKPVKKTDAHGTPEGVQDLKIGERALDFSLPGIDGRTHTLAEYKDACKSAANSASAWTRRAISISATRTSSAKSTASLGPSDSSASAIGRAPAFPWHSTATT
jgi:hypothetical protein